MKLRLSLVMFCLLGIGLFARSQNKKKAQTKSQVENGADAIPVTVQSTKKAHRKPPPPPQPPLLIKDGKPLPPPKVEVVKFTPPKIVKDAPKPPPPPPAKPRKAKAVTSGPSKTDMPVPDLPKNYQS